MKGWRPKGDGVVVVLAIGEVDLVEMEGRNPNSTEGSGRREIRFSSIRSRQLTVSSSGLCTYIDQCECI